MIWRDAVKKALNYSQEGPQTIQKEDVEVRS